MRKHLKELIEIVAPKVYEPIYEFGSLQVDGQEGFADLRQYFKGKEYIGCDYRAGLGVDFVTDITDIKLPDNSVSTILCIDTLEHVCNPQKAVDEMFRILKPGGILLMTSVMYFPIHSYPYDYYRFTPDGFKYLLSNFRNATFYCGHKLKPHTIVGIASKDGDLPNLSKISEWAKKNYNPYKWIWILKIFNTLKPWRKK